MKITKQLSQIALVAIFALISVNLNAQKTSITKNELPKTAQSFITKHFGKATVSSAVKEKEIMKTEYEVYLNNGIEIEFDGDGNWKEVKSHDKTALPKSFIPVSIQKHVQKSFPNTHIVKIEKSRKKYEVEISNGLDLEFNLNGQFLRIDD